MEQMMTFEEWKEKQYGKDHKPEYDERGVCDGTCDTCLRSEYAHNYVLNFRSDDSE